MKLDQHIFLIGFMGCGKSTCAACMCRMTGAEQIEMDQEIVKRQGMEITEIFRVHGEEYFRDLETDLIKEIGNMEPMVVSCGGGTVLREENVALMKAAGRIVLLTAEPETVFDRVKGSADRPVLNGNMNLSYIKELMEARRPRYERRRTRLWPQTAGLRRRSVKRSWNRKEGSHGAVEFRIWNM
ncbi:MAG: shikimate kinase [Enterocloster sp.]